MYYLNKSDLILRDYDLIDELSRITYINVAASVTTMKEIDRIKLEPQGVTSLRRMDMLKAFNKTNASTGLHFMPIIPYITDSRENVEALYSKATESGVDYILPGVLYLRGKTRYAFFDFIKKEYPNNYLKLKALYKTGGASKAYKDELYIMVNELRDKYNLSSSYSKPNERKTEPICNETIIIFDEEIKYL